MSHALRVGVADQIAYFRAYNTDGSAKTDLTSSTTGLSLSVFRIGAAAVSISSLSDKAADNTAHADGAIRAVSGNLYTVDLPDAACADQVPSISVKGSYTGGAIEGPEHPLVGYNPASVAVGALRPTTADRTIAVSAAGAVELDTATTTKINDIKAKTDTLADQTLVLLSDGTNGRQVKVTAAKHIAADVHDVQPEALAKFVTDDTGETTATSGSVAKLAQGSTSGSGTATLEKQEEILAAIDDLSGVQLAAVQVDVGTISGFPETLIIGDSYSEDTGRIRINITDSVTGDPIDSLGSLEFADADVSFTAFRPNDSARITGICEYVREPSSGTLTASYVLITLLTSETAKGKAEYTYEGRLKFVWQGPSSSDETDEEQKTYKTTPFKFIANP